MLRWPDTVTSGGSTAIVSIYFSMDWCWGYLLSHVQVSGPSAQPDPSDWYAEVSHEARQ